MTEINVKDENDGFDRCGYKCVADVTLACSPSPPHASSTTRHVTHCLGSRAAGRLAKWQPRLIPLGYRMVGPLIIHSPSPFPCKLFRTLVNIPSSEHDITETSYYRARKLPS